MNEQQTTINAIRILAAEAIQKANSGHPGLPLGSAPIGYALYAKCMRYNPKHPLWDNRDRFVLSAGHGSMLQYALLHLFGFGLTKEDLMQFRQFGSKTPGHPEYGHTVGIETTTGPLGQGIANAVGMALAEAHLAARFNRDGFPVVDHYTYCLCGDGCLEEGISYEACSFAGTHNLNKLILFYDDNDITIEGNTDVTFKEDVAARFAAQNWNVERVDLVAHPDDIDALCAAVDRAKASGKPSVIICKTLIGYGSPLAGSAKCHGSPLGAEGLQKTKDNLGWTCAPFEVPEAVWAHTAAVAAKGALAEEAWNALFDSYKQAYPDLAAEYELFMSGKNPDFAPIADLTWEKPMATRQTGARVLNAVAAITPNLIGGSADLAPSNLSDMKDTDQITYGYFSPEHNEGRNIHFGIREHAMAAITNGIQLHGGLKAYCATFFIFTDYCKNAMRLSALMHLPVTYIMTHDSIGVGEDGPTHEPVEQLIALRSIPGMKVYRPADGRETAAAWISALSGQAPTTLALSRQNLPQYPGSTVEKALLGGYVIDDCDGTPDVLLLASGSEVEQCVGAKAALAQEGIRARVISMPCFEVFEQQSPEYKESVIPASVKARVCVEAASPYSWYRYAGDKSEIIAMQTFGASAPGPQLFAHFGFTVENIVAKAKLSLSK